MHLAFGLAAALKSVSEVKVIGMLLSVIYLSTFINCHLANKQACFCYNVTRQFIDPRAMKMLCNS